MQSVTLEALESRRLLSVTISESEPNNSRATADVITRLPDELVHVTGKIASLNEHDWFKLQLKAGDVIGVAVNGALPDTGGLDPYARLLDASGRLVIENAGPAFNSGDLLPDESPLPRADRSRLSVEFYRVMAKAGTYYLDVSSYFGDSAGQYQMDVMVARPGMESAPRGKHQILFLDFNGATVDYGNFVGAPADQATLSPMRNTLPGFHLSLSDENAVINAVLRRVKKLLSADIEKRGLNGDYDRSGRAGEFDLEIRNSRDHRDTYGKDPFVSRIVIGGTRAEAGFVGDVWGNKGGLGQDLDVGNFNTHDQAIATLEWITDAVDVVSAAPPLTQIDLFADAVVFIVAHEAAHIFGADHTDLDPADADAGIAQVMNPYVGEAIGPDLILGTADDLDLRLGVDEYSPLDYYAGVNDTLNTLSFGLSTGTGDGHHGKEEGQHHGGWNSSIGHASGAWSLLESATRDEVLAGSVMRT